MEYCKNISANHGNNKSETKRNNNQFKDINIKHFDIPSESVWRLNYSVFIQRIS